MNHTLGASAKSNNEICVDLVRNTILPITNTYEFRSKNSYDAQAPPPPLAEK